MINPNFDGIDHINIYSKGKTELGKSLTNFAHTPVNLGKYGYFESIEGFWFWLGTGDDKLRNMYGYQAKQYGGQLQKYKVENFEEVIKWSLEEKVKQHPIIMKMLAESTLPFKHYYVYGNTQNYKVVNAGFEWITEKWEEIRKELKEGGY
jgi:hypothetical protein